MPTLDFADRVEKTMQLIEDSDAIHDDNKAAIADFKRDLALDGKSDARIQKLTSHLKMIAEHVGDTRFEDMNEDDLKDLVEWVQGREITERTVNDYRKVVKHFWRWLHDLPKGEYPDAVDWINTTPPDGSDKLPKDLLTREDIEALKEGTRNDRDRAFIAMLYETGARIGELIDLTVGDIEENKHGRKIVIEGKTGQRRLPLIESAPAINDWLSSHPSPDSDAPLWSHLREGRKAIGYKYIREKVLGRAGRRAAEAKPQKFAEDPSAIDDPDREMEFYKPLNPHHFRHSRATELAQKFKEAQLCEWFGWVQGSKVPAKYVHLSGRDIDDAYGKLLGIVEEDEEEDRPVKKCPRCEELNERDDRFCSRCGQALEIEAAEEVETAEAATTEAADEDDLQLALQLVQAMQTDREEVEAFVNELAG